MKNIIIMSTLNIWSMDDGKGAQSFNKTVNAYHINGWNVTLINMGNNFGKTSSEVKFNHKLYFIKSKFLIDSKLTSFFGKFIYSFEVTHKLKKMVTKELKLLKGKALIYAYEVYAVKAAYLISRKYNLPLITRFQGTKLTNVNPTFINKIRKYPSFNALATRSNLLIMTDDGTQGDRVVKSLHNDSEMLFVKNGLDQEFFELAHPNIRDSFRQKLNLNESDTMFLTVSRLAKWKRVDRAINLLKKILMSRNNCYLYIIGDGDEGGTLKEYVNKNSLNKNIIFLGSIDHSEVKNYLAAADVFLSFYDISNVGNPLLEAMIQQKMIITIDVGDTNKLIKHKENGLIYNPLELDNVVDDIIQTLNRTEFCVQLKKNARHDAINTLKSWEERMKLEEEYVTEIYNMNFIE